MKPIRVFYSGLSQRFYATRAYKEIKPGIVEVTGQKFDVTADIEQYIDAAFADGYAQSTKDAKEAHNETNL